jgi:membrane fusion protein (multidrug efflux system)
MYVRAIVEEGVAPNSFLVPQRAIARNTKGEPIGMFLDQNNNVEQRALSIGRSVGNNWLVSAGVGDGDRVIVEGSQFVRIGQEATGVEVVLDETTGEVRERKSIARDQLTKG